VTSQDEEPAQGDTVVGDNPSLDPGSAMIEVEGLEKGFDRRAVLDGVTFSVPQGEAFALVGANGAGKTVLLRVLATLVAPDGGVTRIDGCSVLDDPEAVRSRIGYMPEVPGVHPGTTPAEDIAFHAGVHRLPRGRRPQVAANLLELVGLSDRRDDDVARLSRGQRQRLGLARALVHDPAVLLLDDPLGLDPQAQLDLGDLLGELRALGKTVMLASNHLGELEELCSWVGVLDGGSMLAAGPIPEVRGQAATLRDAVVALSRSEPAAS